MHRFRYVTVLSLGLWIAFAAVVDAQEMLRPVHTTSRAPRPFLLRRALQTGEQRPAWMTSARFTGKEELTGIARGLGAQGTSSRQSPRGPVRKVFGALVGAAGGFFAGGYLGAAIEGDRCNCDDPGLKGALIGAPIGAVAGGILGSRYLF